MCIPPCQHLPQLKVCVFRSAHQPENNDMPIAPIEAIEELRLKLPCTVAEYAERVGICISTVRRAIKRGQLTAEKGVKPMLITGGDLTWTIIRWRDELAPYLDGIKPYMRGWTADGELHILDGTEVHVIRRGFGMIDLGLAIKEIEKLREKMKCQQVTKSISATSKSKTGKSGSKTSGPRQRTTKRRT
jgi:hypothetical protein